MADAVTWRRILVAAACLGAAMVRAQGLPDPTRPPQSGVAALDAAAQSGLPPAPKLQSIMLRQGARPRALINGEWVEQGREYAGSKVLKITANAVEISGPQGREMLRLTPDVELRPAQASGADKGRPSNKTGRQE